MLDVSAIIFLALSINQIFLLSFIRSVEGSPEIKEAHPVDTRSGSFQEGKRINQLESNELDKIFSTKSNYSNNKNERGRYKRPARLVPSTSLLDSKNNTGNEAIVDKIPTSCQDLNLLGYTLSGFYLVQGNNSTATKLQTIYCNFQPSTNKTEPLIRVSEIKIGFVDIKTMESGVHFYAHQSSKAPNGNGIMVFDVVRLNLGGALNAKTGIFTAPKPGVYQFAFKGMKSAFFMDSVIIFLRVNRVKSSTAFCNVGIGSGTSVSFHFILKLAKGDRVDLYKTSGQLERNDKEPSIHYTGTLLEEDLNQI